jgi:hypothetical protein
METRFTARRRMAIVLALCLSAFLISVDVTIVNVALPTLVRSLGATTTQLQWVVDAYSLVFAALVLAAGSLSDRQGRKGMLLAGLGLFAAGSLAGALECQFAGNAWQDNGLVFCQPDGRPWNPDYVSKRFKRLAADAGVLPIKLHETRHSANSLMRGRG